MKKHKKKFSFSDLNKFFKGLPSELVGELMLALFSMWSEKYGDDEFELDYDLISGHIDDIIELINDGLQYDEIIKILIKKDKVYAGVWRKVNNIVIKHIPVDEREHILTLMIGNSKMIIPSKEKISIVTSKKTIDVKPDQSKKVWKGNLQEAANEVRRLYQEDEQKPVREYKSLKDAAIEYFENHRFIKYDSKKLNKENFYSLVKKSR